MFDLGEDRTLVVAHFDVEFGGNMPAGVIRSLTKRQFRRGLALLRRRIDTIYQDYDEQPLVHVGFGQPTYSEDVLKIATRGQPDLKLARQSQDQYLCNTSRAAASGRSAAGKFRL